MMQSGHLQKTSPYLNSGQDDSTKTFDLSLVIPVYLNEENIPDLLDAVNSLGEKLDGALEIVFVVDGSPDRSYLLLAEALSTCPIPSQLVSLSRNFGSFAAIRIGMEVARGEFIAVIAADLQEPPELVLSFFDILRRDEADVVFGTRAGREDGFLYRWCAEIFWAFYRRFVVPEIPKGGIDVFACNRKVKDAVLQINEPNSSLIAQLIWVGFRRKFVPYVRQRREKGQSAWKLGRRFRYMLDSLFSFSDLPVTLLLWLGGAGIAISILLSLVVLFARLTHNINVPGYTPIVLVQLFSFSVLLLSQGIIGSYLWRTFENTKKRPLTLIRLHTYFGSR